MSLPTKYDRCKTYTSRDIARTRVGNPVLATFSIITKEPLDRFWPSSNLISIYRFTDRRTAIQKSINETILSKRYLNYTWFFRKYFEALQIPCQESKNVLNEIHSIRHVTRMTYIAFFDQNHTFWRKMNNTKKYELEKDSYKMFALSFRRQQIIHVVMWMQIFSGFKQILVPKGQLLFVQCVFGALRTSCYYYISYQLSDFRKRGRNQHLGKRCNGQKILKFTLNNKNHWANIEFNILGILAQW